MKNRNRSSYIRVVFTRLGIALLIYTLLCAILYYVLDTIMDGYTLEVIADTFSNAAFRYINTHRTTATVFVYFTGFVLIVVVFYVRTLSHMDLLSYALDTALDEQIPLPPFRGEFADFGNQLRDISASIASERNMAKEAEQRKNDLVVFLAHDLKTPLSSVIGYLTLLNETPEISPLHREKFTGIALDKSFRLEQLINEFFEITRFNLQTIELERGTIGLSHLLSQITDEFYPMFMEKQLTLNLQIQPGVHVIGDGDKLARVFDNILRNAVNYSYPDTEIAVSLEEGEHSCVVNVRNKGDEIPEGKLERIFEKFFRLDSARGTQKGGAGVGLAIARQIVELHGGSIRAVSNVEFTEFCVELPKK